MAPLKMCDPFTRDGVTWEKAIVGTAGCLGTLGFIVSMTTVYSEA